MINTVTLVDGKPTGYLSTKEFAESIGAAQSTIRVWIRRQKIEALKIGSEWFIQKGTSFPKEKPRGRRKK